MVKAAGLRTEILTTLTLLMGAALLLGGYMMLRLTEQNLLEQRLVQLDSVMKTLGTALVENRALMTSQSGQSFSTGLLKHLPEELQQTGWWLYDKDLQLRASLHRSAEEPFGQVRLRQVKLSRETARSVEFPALLNVWGNSVPESRIVTPLLRGNRFYGLLEVHFSLNDIRYRLLRSQRLVLFYVLLYGAVLVSVGYYLLQRNVVKPARNLLAATEEIGRGNLETRLPVAGPLELSRLAEAYNEMVEALSCSRRETLAHIDALQQTNNDLKLARAELIRSETLASVGQLAAGLAHELGNPLAALIGYLEILKTRIKQEESRDILQRSLRETERIDFLVRELLDFSRPSESSPEIIDPAEIAKDCLRLLKNQGVFVHRQILESLDVPLPVVRIGRQKLQQVFVNLLLNAVQATTDSGEIRISGGSGERFTWIEISDDGCGINAEGRKRIFDPFYTTKEPGTGTGLGLTICHRLVDEVGGVIEVHSEVGVGSRFRIVLPNLDRT